MLKTVYQIVMVFGIYSQFKINKLLTSVIHKMNNNNVHLPSQKEMNIHLLVL